MLIRALQAVNPECSSALVYSLHRMTCWLKNLVLLSLLVAMPLQSIAAAIAAATCNAKAAQQVSLDDDANVPEVPPTDSDNVAPEGKLGKFCCHQALDTAPSTVPCASAPERPGPLPVTCDLLDLVVSEQLQRPPLS